MSNNKYTIKLFNIYTTKDDDEIHHNITKSTALGITSFADEFMFYDSDWGQSSAIDYEFLFSKNKNSTKKESEEINTLDDDQFISCAEINIRSNDVTKEIFKELLEDFKININNYDTKIWCNYCDSLQMFIFINKQKIVDNEINFDEFINGIKIAIGYSSSNIVEMSSKL